jgi:hypothetical protein
LDSAWRFNEAPGTFAQLDVLEKAWAALTNSLVPLPIAGIGNVLLPVLLPVLPLSSYSSSNTTGAHGPGLL